MVDYEVFIASTFNFSSIGLDFYLLLGLAYEAVCPNFDEKWNRRSEYRIRTFSKSNHSSKESSKSLTFGR